MNNEKLIKVTAEMTELEYDAYKLAKHHGSLLSSIYYLADQYPNSMDEFLPLNYYGDRAGFAVVVGRDADEDLALVLLDKIKATMRYNAYITIHEVVDTGTARVVSGMSEKNKSKLKDAAVEKIEAEIEEIHVGLVQKVKDFFSKNK